MEEQLSLSVQLSWVQFCWTENTSQEQSGAATEDVKRAEFSAVVEVSRVSSDWRNSEDGLRLLEDRSICGELDDWFPRSSFTSEKT